MKHKIKASRKNQHRTYETQNINPKPKILRTVHMNVHMQQ